jgi:pimeloyl-ACP methyl ester carboxylesterase
LPSGGKLRQSKEVSVPELEINGNTIHYEERGQGLPVVLIHGFPLDGRTWEAQLAALSDRWRVIVPDLPGFGQSRLARPFTIESLAHDLHELLVRISALPCVLGGLSMGGYVSFAFVAEFLKDLKGLILVDTKCEADTPEGKQNRLKMIQTAKAGGAKAVADQMMPKMISPAVAQSRPQVPRCLRQIMESVHVATIERASLAMKDRRDYTGELPFMAVPTLIVVGHDDAFAPPAVAQAMQRQLPKARLSIIPNAGHMAPMEQPEAVNEAMRAFLLSIA